MDEICQLSEQESRGVKRDNENTMKNVVDSLARHHGGRMVPELSAKGESQSKEGPKKPGKQ